MTSYYCTGCRKYVHSTDLFDYHTGQRVCNCCHTVVVDTVEPKTKKPMEGINLNKGTIAGGLPVVDTAIFRCGWCQYSYKIDNDTYVGRDGVPSCPKCQRPTLLVETSPKVESKKPMTEKQDNHSDHYQRMGIEPFEIMEQRMDIRLGPNVDYEHEAPTPRQCLALALALKHTTRAGKKEGQHWRKDAEKAKNYIHRALTGEWLGGEKPSGD